MSHESFSGEAVFGYLSTLASAEHGYFGGYLIVSGLGRPLEFHCTAPVRPSRAIEILYGAALRPYLLGEQIGGTLLNAAKLTPQLILTDQAATMHVRSKFSMPIVLVLGRTDQREQPVQFEAPGELERASTLSNRCDDNRSVARGQFAACDYELELPPGYAADKATVVRLLMSLSQQVDLAEPFERIHEAIREAQRIGGRGNEIHGQAA